ncbi:MAG: biopolymer transporter ExbD [Akkermansia sp.]|nr:biopolymer transporter ExbD [Akkermansia sp.]
MNIYTRKAILQGIPIVPMLDILTILLIFFIVQTEFKRQINVLKLDLPRTETLSGEVGDRNNILLEVGDDGRIAFDGHEISADALPAAVQKALQNTPEARIQVAAAEGSSMGRFIEVLDSLAEAGLNIDEIPVRINSENP